MLKSWDLYMRRPNYQLNSVERRIAHKQLGEYEELKRAIFRHLGRRPTFERNLDAPLIEQAARLFADWLYIEELLSSDSNQTNVGKYADALAKIHCMLISTFDELQLTPKMRGKIFKEIVRDDDITSKLKKLVGTA
jgi:hypothetical protein